jgi:hypothetical protein
MGIDRPGTAGVGGPCTLEFRSRPRDAARPDGVRDGEIILAAPVPDESRAGGPAMIDTPSAASART